MQSFRNYDFNLSKQKPPNPNVYWFGITGKKTNKQKNILQSQKNQRNSLLESFSLQYNVSQAICFKPRRFIET